MIKILLVGFIILMAAIVFNIVSSYFNIMGWYDFLTQLTGQGTSIFSKMKWVDYLWLFLVYPFLLGLTCKFAMIIFS